MSDELKEKIAKTLFDWIDDDGWEWEEVDEAIKNHYRGKADSILSLLAPELEKARKWDKVKEWSTFDCDSNPNTCPLDIPDCFSHCSMEDVYNAIQGWYIKEDALEADKEAT